jgi:hypothetical protein
MLNEINSDIMLEPSIVENSTCVEVFGSKRAIGQMLKYPRREVDLEE